MTIKGFTIETNNKSSCNKCQDHIGNYYENADDLPKIPFHYGCKCFYKADIEEIDESIYTEVKNYKDILIKKISDAENLFSQLTHYGVPSLLLTLLKQMLETMHRVLNSIKIFEVEYYAMRGANTHGADKYFHAKANARVAQQGNTGYATAYILSKGREIAQVAYTVIFEYGKLDTKLRDRKEDMKANEKGREIGYANQDASPEEIDSKIRKHFGSPKDLIEDYERRQKLKKK